MAEEQLMKDLKGYKAKSRAIREFGEVLAKGDFNVSEVVYECYDNGGEFVLIKLFHSNVVIPRCETATSVLAIMQDICSCIMNGKYDHEDLYKRAKENHKLLLRS